MGTEAREDPERTEGKNQASFLSVHSVSSAAESNLVSSDLAIMHRKNFLSARNFSSPLACT